MPERSSTESSDEYRGSGWGRMLLPITLVVALVAAVVSGWLLFQR